MDPPIVKATVYGNYMEEAAAIALAIQPAKSLEGMLAASQMPAEEDDNKMQEAVQGLVPGAGLASATLAHGIGLTKVTKVSSTGWFDGYAQVQEGIRELYPTVTVGAEDLGAERNFPYVQFLQAAMQKVTEAMRGIEEARRADEHLPRQIPKANDVRKLSDYSSS
ncbi:hypothetical protein CYMTET_43189 [Cymbomonas tetramitiformis]|uniref:Uncharacterized protein n=1 Tax=Cymbomonas tetramitiformis TaxID=36881 RepID=A0AAE0C2N0_9CHLO|nr:hypothetical protein CYMTET_43189 [Cymbomonas tetramitiformis]